MIYIKFFHSFGLKQSLSLICFILNFNFQSLSFIWFLFFFVCQCLSFINFMMNLVFIKFYGFYLLLFILHLFYGKLVLCDLSFTSFMINLFFRIYSSLFILHWFYDKFIFYCLSFTGFMTSLSSIVFKIRLVFQYLSFI